MMIVIEMLSKNPGVRAEVCLKFPDEEYTELAFKTLAQVARNLKLHAENEVALAKAQEENKLKVMIHDDLLQGNLRDEYDRREALRSDIENHPE